MNRRQSRRAFLKTMAATLDWIDGIMFTYNYRIMDLPEMKQAVEACYRAGIGLTAMKTMGGGPGQSLPSADERLSEPFMQQGYTEHQAKLKAVWEDQRIAAICSHMPNTTILQANSAAAMDKTHLAVKDQNILKQHSRETCNSYCAGCSALCESALQDKIPIGEVMRSLMYLESHAEPERARQTFKRAFPHPANKETLKSIDFTEAQRVCPQGLDIGALIHRAADLFT